MNQKHNRDEAERQARLIHVLAARLPWIVVIVTLLTAVVTLLEIFVFGKS